MKVDKEANPLCHVAMVAKFLDLNTTVFLQIWWEKTKKNGNKTGRRANTSTK